MPVRIYELAREFDMPSKEMVAVCREAGLQVKSHSSTIDEDEAEMIRRQLGAVGRSPERNGEAAEAAPAKPAPAEAPPAEPETAVEPEPELSADEQLARARSMRIRLPTRHASKPKAEGLKPSPRRRPPAKPPAEPEEALPAEAAAAVAEEEGTVAEAPAETVGAEEAPPAAP
ncbi:MAG: translation initiation factor IF-2 N-terminal domain-containing protein, partial [Phycisphaerae bacterium]